MHKQTQATRDKIRSTMRKRWKKVSPKVKTVFARMMSKRMRNFWRNMSVVDRQVLSKRRSVIAKKRFADPKNHPQYGRRGRKSPWYGRKHSKKSIEKISKAKTGISLPQWVRNKMSKSRIGAKNPAYIDGRALGRDYKDYSKEFKAPLKQRIRERDGHRCQVCGMHEKKHLIRWGCVLSIHHADYNKKNCKDSNLFSVCIKCNAKVNFNRHYWTRYFRKLYKELYTK